MADKKDEAKRVGMTRRQHRAYLALRHRFTPRAQSIPSKPSMLTDREVAAFGGVVSGNDAVIGNGWRYAWDEGLGLWVSYQ